MPWKWAEILGATTFGIYAVGIPIALVYWERKYKGRKAVPKETENISILEQTVMEESCEDKASARDYPSDYLQPEDTVKYK